MSDNRNRSAGARGVCSVDAGGLVTAPIRGQRRRLTEDVAIDPDLVLLAARVGGAL